MQQALDLLWNLSLVLPAAFLAAFILTPIMRRIAIRYEVIDRPDHERKMHREPIAYLGGVAIFFGWLAGLTVSLWVHQGLDWHDSLLTIPWFIVLGAVTIVGVGVIDDIYGISPQYKIAGQLFAAAALATQNVELPPLADGESQAPVFLGAKIIMDSGVLLTAWGIPLADQIPYLIAYILGTAAIAIFVLGGCNAVNLIDGLDGLAAGVIAIASVGLLIISVTLASNLTAGHQGIGYGATQMVLCLALLGALLGFLPYNFNPAKIFMGDAGSLLIGFLSVSTILQFGLHPNSGPVYIVAGLVVLGLPIGDTMLAIVRRKLQGLAISAPDRNHIHHIALRRFRAWGFKDRAAVKAAVLSLYGISVMFLLVGTSLIYLRGRWVFAIALVFLLIALLVAFRRGYRQAIIKELAQSGKDLPPEKAASLTAAGPPLTENEPVDPTIPITKRPSRHHTTHAPVDTISPDKAAPKPGSEAKNQ